MASTASAGQSAAARAPATPDDKRALASADSMAATSTPGSRQGSGPGPAADGGPDADNYTVATSTRPKGQLVQLAEQQDRARAVIKGYLRKENSAGKWQKRWFEVVGRYFVYYKRSDSPNMLCAMDLWKAHTPEIRTHEGPSGARVATNEFSIQWDRFRLFRAENAEEAVRWVNVLRATQAANPAMASLTADRSSSAQGGGAGGGTGGSKCCCVVQ